MNDTTSSSVPATPVVRIEIFGSTVSVNGVVILHDGTSSLHQVAVQAAADRVAKALGRPVRAMATDSEGRASMIIHPDGRATDIQLMDEAAPVAPVVAAPAPVVAPVVAPLPAAPVAAAPAPEPEPLATQAMPAAGAAAAPFARPVRPAGAEAASAWPSKVVRSVGLAAALVAVVGMGVLLLGTRDDDGADQAATDRSGETSPVASGASEEPVTSTDPVSTAPELTVVALPGSKSLRLTIETTLFSSTAPPVASVRVELANGKVIERSVELPDSSTEVDLDRLAPGPATWTVEVPGAEVQTDQTTISDTFVAATPTPTPTPEPVVPPTTTTDDGALAAAKAAERAAKQAAREAKAEARQAKAQARAANQAKQQKQTETKKKQDKPKSDFGRKTKKKRSDFG